MENAAAEKAFYELYKAKTEDELDGYWYLRLPPLLMKARYNPYKTYAEYMFSREIESKLWVLLGCAMAHAWSVFTFVGPCQKCPIGRLMMKLFDKWEPKNTDLWKRAAVLADCNFYFNISMDVFYPRHMAKIRKDMGLGHMNQVCKGTLNPWNYEDYVSDYLYELKNPVDDLSFEDVGYGCILEEEIQQWSGILLEDFDHSLETQIVPMYKSVEHLQRVVD